MAWFTLDLELILFDYSKYFGTELKNVQCQLVFVWGGPRLSGATGEAGGKFTRKVYITRILMLITGINTAQICFLHKQIFLQFRDHISQSSIHGWYICLHRGTVQLFNVRGEKYKWNLLLEIKMLEVCCRVRRSLLVAMEVGAEENSLYIQIWDISSAWCHLNIFQW